MKKPRRTAARTPLGAHQSIAGGFAKAVERAVETGSECLQIFTRNINQWDVKPILPADAAAFRAAVREAGLACVVAEAVAKLHYEPCVPQRRIAPRPPATPI